MNMNQIHELFEYRDGHLYRRVTTSHNAVKGTLVKGSISGQYYRVRVGSERYGVHQVIFYMFNGFLPVEIDHIDRNKLNNCIENLRAATVSQNASNRPTPKRNTSGAKGVSWHTPNLTWRVQISLNRKVKHIGYFKDFELAEFVAAEARNKYHGAFASHA